MPHEIDTSPQGRRGAGRDSLLLMTELRGEDGRMIGSARVRNISASGLMAECSLSLKPGDRIILGLRGVGEVIGTVQRTDRGRIGVAFDKPIDPQAVRKPVTEKVTEAPPIFPGRLFQ